MTVTYINPYEQMQENIAGIGEGIGEGIRRKKNRKLVEEALSQMSPEEQKLFSGYQDPQEFAKAKVLYANNTADNQRLAEQNRQDRELKERELNEKLFADENKNLDTAFRNKEFTNPQDYADAKNALYAKYKKGTPYEINPQYSAAEAARNPFTYNQGPVRIRPLKDVELEEYGKKKEIDTKTEKEKGVQSLNNQKTLEGVKHSNKIQEIKTSGEVQKKVKGSPTFEEDRKDKARKNPPKSNDDLTLEQISKDLRMKLNGY